MARKIKLFKQGETPEGVWVEFDGMKVKVRPWDASKIREIQKQALKSVSEYKNGRFMETDQTDPDLEDRLTADYLIEAWEDLEDMQGEPIPCNQDTKTAMVLQDAGLKQFIMMVSMNYSKHLAAQEALKTENLSDSSAGKKVSRRTAPPAE